MGLRERKEREKQLRRQQIQDAAKKLFMIKGFTSATMEDIAQECELSVATIYQYFKNKEELYASLNLITLSYLLREVEKVYKNPKLSVEDKITGFKEAMYKTYSYEPLILRNIFHIQLEDTLLSLSSELLNEINGLVEKIMTMIAKTYEDGVRQGKLRQGHGMAHADIIWAIFTGLVLWEESKKKLDPQKNFLKDTLDTAFDIFCRGINK